MRLLNITTDQAKVLSILINLALKVLIALTCIVAFFIILGFIIKTIKDCNDVQPWALTILDSVLAGTMYILVSHYFKKNN